MTIICLDNYDSIIRNLKFCIVYMEILNLVLYRVLTEKKENHIYVKLYRLQ